MNCLVLPLGRPRSSITPVKMDTTGAQTVASKYHSLQKKSKGSLESVYSRVEVEKNTRQDCNIMWCQKVRKCSEKHGAFQKHTGKAEGAVAG